MARGAFPARARQSVVYEVRIYSIAGSSCGEVVWAKRIRAAHCLTSLQFSPTSGHILLAYGRQVLSLVTSICAEFGSNVAFPLACGLACALRDAAFWQSSVSSVSAILPCGDLSAMQPGANHRH